MRQRVIWMIYEYIADLKLPCYRRTERFEQACWSIWAAETILESVFMDTDRSPMSIIEDYVNKFKKYSLTNPGTSKMFSTAYETAVNILDILIAMQP